jgi:hypothetical protein
MSLQRDGQLDAFGRTPDLWSLDSYVILFSMNVVACTTLVSSVCVSAFHSGQIAIQHLCCALDKTQGRSRLVRQHSLTSSPDSFLTHTQPTVFCLMAHVQPPSRRGRHRFSLFGAKIYAVPEPTPEEDGSSPTKEDGSVPKVDENEDRAVSTVAGHTPETTSDPSGLTTTTSGTFPGLGAVLGKLARALGKLELRLIECIIIQRRLLHIKRHLSAGDTSENDMVSNEGGLEMFDDIWELSRFVFESTC